MKSFDSALQNLPDGREDTFSVSVFSFYIISLSGVLRSIPERATERGISCEAPPARTGGAEQEELCRQAYNWPEKARIAPPAGHRPANSISSEAKSAVPPASLKASKCDALADLIQA
ncbi:hypothetical protein GCM10011415_25520 [Salipiger pallidus]|uniref:Uncharacterized protein n=1 Tax=Salipiger pallidus TaxID=1775170 RepID=A0A8J3EGE0_9RHOB|nr:hypothetical protein [Salipiger pallidus]GGG75788.1 hypothetical protein GCM10011415_25520 [Salipiger pallidus]